MGFSCRPPTPGDSFTLRHLGVERRSILRPFCGSDLLTSSFNSWSWSYTASLNADGHAHSYFLFRVGPMPRRFGGLVSSSQNCAKPQSQTVIDTQPKASTQAFLPALPWNGFPPKWWTRLAALWSPSVLSSPFTCVGPDLINRCSSHYTSCYGIMDFIQYFFPYCAWLLTFLLRLLLQLPRSPSYCIKKLKFSLKWKRGGFFILYYKMHTDSSSALL